MSPQPQRETSSRCRRPIALALFVLFSAAATITAAAEKEVNVVQSVKSTPSGAVEIEIASAQPFIKSDLPVLRIGSTESSISRPPKDGSLYVRIFSFSGVDYAKRMKSGDQILFQWGRGSGKPTIEFGRLDKRRLQK